MKAEIRVDGELSWEGKLKAIPRVGEYVTFLVQKYEALAPYAPFTEEITCRVERVIHELFEKDDGFDRRHKPVVVLDTKRVEEEKSRFRSLDSTWME